MKSLRRILVALLFLAVLVPAAPAFAQAAQAFGPYAPLPQSKELYSFADLYRLTVAADWPALPSGGTAAAAAANEFQIRTVAGNVPAAAAAPSYVFSIARVAQPQGLLLLVAGIAAAFWVARRRLGYAIRG